MLGSTHSPGARGEAATTGRGATSTGSGSGSSGMSMSESSSSGGSSSSIAVSLGTAGTGATATSASTAPSVAITKGLPCHSAVALRPAAAAVAANARATEARGTPVAMRIATMTTATSRTAAPAGPRPAWRGRPTTAPRYPPASRSEGEADRRGVPLASSASPQTPSRPSTVPTASRHGSAPSSRSWSSSRPRSTSNAVPAPTATSGSRTRAQPARSASPVSVPWPTGPSCWPHSANASSTPSVTRPTAQRSRAWTRQNGAREGADRFARAAGFLAPAREGARVEVPPRVLVTTVRLRLLPDLVLFADTRPVELRTYVRYPNPDGTPVGTGRERGGTDPLPRRARGGTPCRQGRLRRHGVPPRERPHDHQHRAAGERGAVPAHDQPVSRLQPRLRLLLRPADPRLSRARDRDRFRAEDRGQGQRCRTVAGRAALAQMGRRQHRHGHQHRPLPARRGQIPPHERHRRDAVAGAQPVQHLDQVDARPARRRPARGGVRAHRGGGELLHRHARPLRVVADRAGHTPAGPEGRGAAAADGPWRPVRGPGGPGAPWALRLRRTAAPGRRGVRGGRRRLRPRRGAAPARPAARPLLRLAGGHAARPGPTPPRALPARRLPGGRRAWARGGHRAGGGAHLWRDGAGPLPGHDARGVPTRTGTRRWPAAAPSLRRRVVAAPAAPYDLALMPRAGSLTRGAGRRAALGMAVLLAACALVMAPPTGRSTVERAAAAT